MDSSADITATTRALNTPHILELILSFLPMHSLLLQQRVNHTFLATIKSSTTLQRKLFFTTSPTCDPDARTRLATYPEDLDLDLNLDLDPPPCSFDPRLLHRVRLNPLLVATFPNFFPGFGLDGNRDSFLKLPWAQDERRRRAVLRADASWRNMLLCEPQPVAASFRWSISTAGGQRFRGAHLKLPVRMGIVYDLVHEIVVEKGRWASASFDVFRNVADAYTEEEWLLEQSDRKECVIALEAETEEFILDIEVRHFFGCIVSAGRQVAGLQSKSPDVVKFETIQCKRHGCHD